MNYIEMTGKSIVEAVEKAKDVLGLDYDQIEHEIIEEPKKGFLGFGSKDAKVLVWKKGIDVKKEMAKAAEAKAKAEKKAAKEAEKAREKAAKAEIKEVKREEKKTAKKAEAAAEAKAEKPKNIASVKEAPKAKAQPAPKAEQPEPKANVVPEEGKPAINTDKAVSDASAFLSEVFNAMKLENVAINKKDEKKNQLYLELTGDDMGVIIGKRGQTLDSLQYLTNLVVNRGSSPYISIHLDTKDYRAKRKETLETLARNLAKKAKHLRRDQHLEPMNPYERRIIHSTLQNDRYVTTFSQGEEPYRHVVISPKYK